MQAMNLLSGRGLVPWNLIDGDIVLATVFGGIAAAGSMRLAEWADAIGPGPSRDELEGGEQVGRPAPPRR